MEFRQNIVNGYTKSPELLSRLVARLFWHVGEDDYLFYVREFVKDVNTMVGDDGLPKLFEDIAEAIRSNIASGSEDN